MYRLEVKDGTDHICLYESCELASIKLVISRIQKNMYIINDLAKNVIIKPSKGKKK